MKISEEQLKQVIKEETQGAISEHSEFLYLALLSERENLTEEEFEQKLIDEGIFDWFKKLATRGWDATKEAAIEVAVKKTLGAFGFPEDSFWVRVTANTIDEMDMKDWKAVWKGTAGCNLVADRIMRGVLESVADILLDKLQGALTAALGEIYGSMGEAAAMMPDPRAQLVSVAAKYKAGDPLPMGTTIGFGIGKEAIVNYLHDIEFIDEARGKLASMICDAVGDIKRGEMPSIDL